METKNRISFASDAPYEDILTALRSVNAVDVSIERHVIESVHFDTVSGGDIPTRITSLTQSTVTADRKPVITHSKLVMLTKKYGPPSIDIEQSLLKLGATREGIMQSTWPRASDHGRLRAAINMQAISKKHHAENKAH